MQHPLELEIHELLSAYLTGEVSLREFEDWFLTETWSIDTLSEPALLDLVYQIKLAWAEFTNGDYSLEEFRSMLRSIDEKYTISFSSYKPKVISGTSSKNLRLPLLIMRSGLSAGIKSSVVYG